MVRKTEDMIRNKEDQTRSHEDVVYSIKYTDKAHVAYKDACLKLATAQEDFEKGLRQKMHQFCEIETSRIEEMKKVIIAVHEACSKSIQNELSLTVD